MWRALLLLILGYGAAWAEDLSSLCKDRTAIEQVYYNHRTGTKPPFDQALPRAALESLVRRDLNKETVLREHYGVAITPAMLDTEVHRINTTTRAPEMLAEIKAPLDNDPTRFAEAFAKPFLVERLLRDKFENDDALHAPQRREAERVRKQILSARNSRREETPSGKSEIRKDDTSGVSNLVGILRKAGVGQVTETTWQLTPRPAETNSPTADELEIKKRFGPDAQLFSSPHASGAERKFYFEDLPSTLRRVLRVQLRQVGDVSAVIETPGGFLLYVATERTKDSLSVACLSLSKRSYEQWLNEQSGGEK